MVIPKRTECSFRIFIKILKYSSDPFSFQIRAQYIHSFNLNRKQMWTSLKFTLPDPVFAVKPPWNGICSLECARVKIFKKTFPFMTSNTLEWLAIVCCIYHVIERRSWLKNCVACDFSQHSNTESWLCCT